MILLEDTRNQVGKHDKKNEYFSKNGIEVRRTKLYCGEALTDRIPMDNKDFYFHCLNCGQKFNWESDENE